MIAIAVPLLGTKPDCELSIDTTAHVRILIIFSLIFIAVRSVLDLDSYLCPELTFALVFTDNEYLLPVSWVLTIPTLLDR